MMEPFSKEVGDFQVPAVSFKGGVCGPAQVCLFFFITIPHLPAIINFCCLDDLGWFSFSQIFSVKMSIYFYTLNFGSAEIHVPNTPWDEHQTFNLTFPSSEDGATRVSRRPVMHPAFQGSEALRQNWTSRAQGKSPENCVFFGRTPAFFSMAKGGLEIITSETLLNMLV